MTAPDDFQADPPPERPLARPEPRPRRREYDDEDFRRPSAGEDAASTIIPYKNPKALAAYYCGVFGLIPCVGAILGPIALILGILGLRYAKANPTAKGTGHAIAGIVLGGLTLLANWGGLIFLLVSVIKATEVATKVADETANRSEIADLEVSLMAFKERFGVSYVPSRIWLDESMQYTASPPGQPASLANDSRLFLAQVWPQLKFGAGAPAVDWNGDGVTGNSAEVLEGDQCLVFFLGGIPVQNGVATTGFSTNPRNPAAHITGGGDVILPFYEIRSARLVKLRNTSRYYSYMDCFGQTDGQGGAVKGKPYAYFSSYKAGNDYERYGPGDCGTLGVAPYHEPRTVAGQKRFHNPLGFQILSAGIDQKFGPGGPWSPASASDIPVDGRDDQANFFHRKLGASP